MADELSREERVEFEEALVGNDWLRGNEAWFKKNKEWAKQNAAANREASRYMRMSHDAQTRRSTPRERWTEEDWANERLWEAEQRRQEAETARPTEARIPTKNPTRDEMLHELTEEMGGHVIEWVTALGAGAGITLLLGWLLGYPWFAVFGSKYSTLFWIAFVYFVLWFAGNSLLIRVASNKTDKELLTDYRSRHSDLD